MTENKLKELNDLDRLIKLHERALRVCGNEFTVINSPDIKNIYIDRIDGMKDLMIVHIQNELDKLETKFKEI